MTEIARGVGIGGVKRDPRLQTLYNRGKPFVANRELTRLADGQHCSDAAFAWILSKHVEEAKRRNIMKKGRSSTTPSPPVAATQPSSPNPPVEGEGSVSVRGTGNTDKTKKKTPPLGGIRKKKTPPRVPG